MKTAVMTDSNSGIHPQEAKERGIFVIPMPVILEGETFYEGVNLTQEDFYHSLADGMRVSTSQPSPGDVLDMWEQILSSGYDELVYIPMSSGLSHSCETAISLSASYDGRVQVADNHRISVTLREAVLAARRMADAGAPAREIRQELEAHAYDASIYIAVNTLEFLKRGGRVTPAGAALGAVLNIKPVLTIQGERLDAFAKVRGMKKATEVMVNALKNDRATRFREAEESRIRIGAAGSGLSAEEAAAWTSMLAAAFPQATVYYDPLSFSIGCHTGPGALGVGMSLI